MNRTLSVLHSYLAISLAKKAYIRKILNSTMQILKEKSLDVKMVKKVLNVITNFLTNKNVDAYLNMNILHVLNFWNMKSYHIGELPLQLFGLADQRMLLEKHMKWLVSTDILWRNDGNINASEVLKQAKEKLGVSESKIVEVQILANKALPTI